MTLLAALSTSRFKAAASFSGAPYWSPFTDGRNLPFDKTDSREVQLRSAIVYAGSFKCPVRMYYGTEEADFAEMMTQRTAALAKSRGLDVEALDIDGTHASHVRFSIPRSVLFFRKFLPAESAQKTEATLLPKPLPATLDIDLRGGTKLNVRRIEPGKFVMGSPLNEAGRRPDEQQHEVVIIKPFAIGIYTVTQAQYRKVMGQNPAFLSDKGEGWRQVLGVNTSDFPIENINLEEAMEFCQMLSRLPAIRDNGWVVDLPTEEEWEYAARAGTTTAFAFGDSLSSEQANFDGNLPYGNAAKGPSIGRATKVGSYKPNAWGLYDMQGNVLQWTKTVYSPSYQSKDAKDPSRIVTRGGLWLMDGRDLRSARRLPQDANVRGGALGFRLVVRARG